MNTQDAASAFLASCAAAGRTPRTLRQYRWALRYLPPVLPTTPEQIEAVLARETWCGTSKLAVYRVLHAFFGWTTARYDTPNPIRAVLKPKAERRVPATFSPVQLRMIWAKCRTVREKALTRTLLDTGARLGEVANLRDGDIRGGTVQLRGKTGERVGFMSAATAQLLDRSKRADAYFPARSGRPLTASGVYQSFKCIVRRAKIRGRRIGPHTMRHTFATEFLRQGGDLITLKRLLGHRSLSTTEMYVHQTDIDVRDAHGRVSVAGRLLEGAA